MDRYRLLAQKDEISKMIKKAPVMEIGEIWQTLPIKRQVYRITKLELLNEALIFKTQLPFQFDQNFPIYIKINYNNLIFKLSTEEYRTFTNQLSCSYPKEAKAIENRTLDRTKLPRKFNLNVMLKTTRGDSLIELKVNLEDISESGLGIRTSSANIELFTEEARFKLFKIAGHYLSEEATLSVRHISSKDKQGYLSIGMHADTPFSEKLFELLREAIRKERFVAK